MALAAKNIETTRKFEIKYSVDSISSTPKFHRSITYGCLCAMNALNGWQFEKKKESNTS